MKEDSVWKAIESKPPVSLRFQQIEELFCAKPSTTPAVSSVGGRTTVAKPTVPALLNSKRSLAINIFIRQFKCPFNEIVEYIHRCNTIMITSEQLRALQKIFPDSDEVLLIS